MLRDVPAWGCALIRAVQPIPNAPREDIGQSLKAIDTLAQRDRHRALLLHVPVLTEAEVAFYPDPTTPAPPRISIDRQGTRTIIRYPTGTLLRLDYRARVMLAEDVQGARDVDIARLARNWWTRLTELVNLTEDALDDEWRLTET